MNRYLAVAGLIVLGLIFALTAPGAHSAPRGPDGTDRVPAGATSWHKGS